MGAACVVAGSTGVCHWNVEDDELAIKGQGITVAQSWDATQKIKSSSDVTSGQTWGCQLCSKEEDESSTSSYLEDNSCDSSGSLENYTFVSAFVHGRGVGGVLDRRTSYRLWQTSHVPRHAFTPSDFHIRRGIEAELSFTVVPGFLSAAEISAVHVAGQQQTTTQCKDRSAELEYAHVAYRFEKELRASARELYCRLLGTMVWADLMLWRSLHDYKKVWPEVEYIRYDGAPTKKDYAIEPHVDNHSLVTLVCMLSDPGDFRGGKLGFAPADGNLEDVKGYRSEELTAGSAVIFRGEELLHWVTPVTAGTRYVLQIELSNV